MVDTGTRLDINLWYGEARVFADFQRAQVSASYNMKSIYAEAMADKLARKLDTDLLALGSSLNPAVGDSATDVKVSTIEEVMSIVDSYSLPHEDLMFFFHPTVYWNELRGDPRLTDSSNYGIVTTPYGQIPTLFGIPLYLTTQIPAGTDNSEGGHRNLLVHKNAFVWALGNIPGTSSQGVRVQEFPGYSGTLATKVVADIMYGVKLLSSTYGVRIISNN